MLEKKPDFNSRTKYYTLAFVFTIFTTFLACNQKQERILNFPKIASQLNVYIKIINELKEFI